MQFACASALAMLVEGEPEMCPQVLRHAGVAALTIMLQTAGAQGRKAAAEALQVHSRCPSGHTSKASISGLPGVCTTALRPHSSDWKDLHRDVICDCNSAIGDCSAAYGV